LARFGLSQFAPGTVNAPARVAGCLLHPPASDDARQSGSAKTVSASLERGMDVVCGQTFFSFSSFRTHRSFAGSTSSPGSVARFGASPDGDGGSRRRFRAESRHTRSTAARSTRASALRATSRPTSSRVLDAPSCATVEFQERRIGYGDGMANPAPVGSDVSAGTYRCTNCGYELDTSSVKSLPPCPNCSGPQEWEAMSGGDSSTDPYPDRSQ
jgi:hypothetical protein